MRRLIFLFLALALLSACSSIDCPLNTTVMSTWLVESDTAYTPDTLTISTQRAELSDSVLLNKAVAPDSFSLPMSYAQAQDVLYFESYVSDTTVIDTVTISKTNDPHFESIDCNPGFFHTITGITTTRHAIDSLKINNKTVSYDASRANIHIYFKSTVE